VIFDFFRNITTTFFKPPKPTMERLEQRQEEWRRKYMPYATHPTPPSKPSTPSPSSQLPSSTPARVVKPPSSTITLPRISPPKIPTFDIMGFSQQIRRELRREGVPVWHYTGRLQVPTPQKIWMGIQYITGFASKLAERAERKYESVVVQPVLAKVSTPTKFSTNRAGEKRGCRWIGKNSYCSYRYSYFEDGVQGNCDTFRIEKRVW